MVFVNIFLGCFQVISYMSTAALRPRLAAKHGLAEHVWAVEAVPGMAKMAKQLVCHGEAGFGGDVKLLSRLLQGPTCVLTQCPRV